MKTQEGLLCFHKKAFAFSKVSNSPTDTLSLYNYYNTRIYKEDTEGCLVCKRQQNLL